MSYPDPEYLSFKNHSCRWIDGSGKGCMTSFGSVPFAATFFAFLRPSPLSRNWNFVLCPLCSVLDQTILIHTVSRVIFIHYTASYCKHRRQPDLCRIGNKISDGLCVTNPQTEEYKSCDHNVHGWRFHVKRTVPLWPGMDRGEYESCQALHLDAQFEMRAKPV